MKIPKSHPRYSSLKTRDKLEAGVRDGITSLHGLIAHGRGEAFDYLLGEKTHEFAKKSADSAAAMLLLAKNPVISVNGNTAALVPDELAELSRLLGAPLEVNVFHKSKGREIKIKKHLVKKGASFVLLPQKNAKIKHLESNRKYVHPKGILRADVVLVPLEDGDRAEALTRNGKKVITIDLNPLSRTSQKATITIVDNATRAIPLLANQVKKFKKLRLSKKQLKAICACHDNGKMIDAALKMMRNL